MAAIKGDITCGVYLYDFDSTYYEGDTFSGIAPLQRIKVEAKFDKPSYNQDVFNSSNGTGNFDANLASLTVYLSDDPPATNEQFPSPNQIVESLTVSSTDTMNELISSVVLRAQEIWANQLTIKYITFIWRFQYGTTSNAIKQDLVRKTFVLNFRKFDDGTNIEFLNFTDDDDNVLDGEFCSTYEGKITANFKNKLPNTYTQIGVSELPNGGIIIEENSHSNNNLSEENSFLFNSIDPVNPINQDDDFKLIVNTNLLAQGTEYCISPILIQEAPLPVATDCPCFAVTLSQTVESQNLQQIQYGGTFTLTGITPAEVNFVKIVTNGDVIGQFVFQGATTGTFTTIIPLSQPSAKYTLLINLLSGCSYSSEFSLPQNSNENISQQACTEVVSDFRHHSDTSNTGFPFLGTITQIELADNTTVVAGSFDMSSSVGRTDLQTAIQNYLNANGGGKAGVEFQDLKAIIDIVATTIDFNGATITHNGTDATNFFLYESPYQSSRRCNLEFLSPQLGDNSKLFLSVLGRSICDLPATDSIADLKTCIETELTNLDFEYNSVEVEGANAANINTLRILSTDAPLQVFSANYEDFGKSKGTSTCQPSKGYYRHVSPAGSINPILGIELLDSTQILTGNSYDQTVPAQVEQLRIDLQNWLDVNNYGGSILITEQLPFGFTIIAINTVAPLLGAKLIDGTGVPVQTGFTVTRHS